jgi:hypothetical protein
MRLNTCIIAYDYIFLNFNKRANKTAVAYDTTIQIGRFDDGGIFAKNNTDDTYLFFVVLDYY